MRNLLRCRRGSAAFATVIALVPLIGVVALGGEAGSWYVTKQHAQNAADAAAYSGALRQLHALMQRTLCGYTNSGLSRQGIRGSERVLQRGRHLLSRLPVCHQPSDRNLADRRRSTPLTSWNGDEPEHFVQATVSQQQPAYLAEVLGLSTVNIGATAVAQVKV